VQNLLVAKRELELPKILKKLLKYLDIRHKLKRN